MRSRDTDKCAVWVIIVALRTPVLTLFPHPWSPPLEAQCELRKNPGPGHYQVSVAKV